ncbi:MAG: hypothetical protein J6S43_02310 [Lentisphaeria bacterium]|nr:hypothetical protein [Lentisphaeria bacterium]
MFRLSFDKSGCLDRLTVDGVGFAETGKARLFTLQFRDFAGNPLRFSRADFRECRVEERDGNWQLTFSGTRMLPQLTVHVSIKCTDMESRWFLEVDNDRDELAVEWVSFPELPLRCGQESRFLLPYAEGTLVSDLVLRQNESYFPCREAAYPLTGVSSFYPGPAAMQFEAVYDDTGCGLYFGVEDNSFAPKTIDFMPDGEHGFYPFIQHFTGGRKKIAYATVIRGFHGQWQDAANIYREFLEKSQILPEKLEKRAPAWLMDAPVVLAYPVKGYGIDHGDMSLNEYYPYDRALPVMEKYREMWKNPVMALLIHWEGTAPWAPPYVWPPVGGTELLKSFIDRMHENGDRVGLYCSGIGWTQQSMIKRSYDCRKEFEEKELIKEVCKGPHGEAFALVCNGPTSQRIGYELCPSRTFTVETVCSQISFAAAGEVDYLQYFDQNQGCTSPLCYAEDHGHGNLPDHRQSQAMQKLLDRAHESAGKMVLGCENAAAEPYMQVCAFNDLRSHLAWGAAGKPVPLYPYLYHEYVAGFSGNGVCLHAWIDFAATPFFLQWTVAWNFVNGNLLSLVLKNDGKIHWHWGLRWEVPEPEQKSVQTLTGNLCAWRQGAAKAALSRGKMLKAPPVICAEKEVVGTDGRRTRLPAVESALWQIDGREELILVNYSASEEMAEVLFDRVRDMELCTGEKSMEFTADRLKTAVPPLNAVLVRLK